ncbi:hypothetical protein G7046_g1050 [Stylonectria norvegica]|nr:hypothetical protein G7046_g1050 [Stylonectria norvegica]
MPVLPNGGPNGGLRAWLVVGGAFVNFVTAFGLMNSFGTFQLFYQTEYITDRSASIIAWIGGVQLCLLFLGGLPFGWAFDRVGSRPLMITGSIIVVLSYIGMSFATKFSHLLVAQGFAFGIRNSMVYYPSSGAISGWFTTKRALALGLAISGSSVGGIIWPIVITTLLKYLSFAWAMRVVALIIGPILAAACILVRECRPSDRENNLAQGDVQLSILSAHTLDLTDITGPGNNGTNNTNGNNGTNNTNGNNGTNNTNGNNSTNSLQIFQMGVPEVTDTSSTALNNSAFTEIFNVSPDTSVSVNEEPEQAEPAQPRCRTWSDLKLLLLCPCLCLIYGGMLVPFGFIPTVAKQQGMSKQWANNILAIGYAGSTMGRILTGWAGDHFGRVNVLMTMGLLTGTIIFAWSGMNGMGGQIVFALIFGFGSGGLMPLGSAYVAQTTTDMTKVGTRIGIMMAICSLSTMAGGPVAGAIHDLTGNWVVVNCFSAGMVFLGLFALLCYRLIIVRPRTLKL